MERDIILVPTDFTPVADCALDHAIEIAKISNHKICLLHVVNRNLIALQQKKFEIKLEKIANKNSNRSGIEIIYRVEAGSIYEEINKVASLINAEFIVMGIHGKKGIEHIIGSYTYKLIYNSIIPVMVVKKKHHHEGYKNIVIPIDFSHESSQKINKAIRFGKYFHSTIHVIGVLSTTSSAYKIKKEALLKKVHDYIEEQGVNSVSEVIINPDTDVQDEVLAYCEKVDADLIMIVAEKSGPFTELLGRNVAEQIIDKADIPVLTVIPSKEYDEDDDENMISSFFDPLGIMDKTNKI